MEATTLYLANGAVRIVKGAAADIGGALRVRAIGADNGVRQFVTTDGDTITVNVGAVVLAETAAEKAAGVFGFARALA